MSAIRSTVMGGSLTAVMAFVLLGRVAYAVIDWCIDKYGKVRPKPEIPYPRQYERYRQSIVEYTEREGISVDDKPAEMVKTINSAVKSLEGKHPIPGVNRWWKTKLQDNVEFKEGEISAEKCDELLHVAANFWAEVYVMDEIGGWRNQARSFFLTDEQLEDDEDDSDDE